MIRFLRSWLVPILVLLMVLGIAVAIVTLTKQSSARAESELSLIMDRAMTRIGASAHQAEPVIAAEEKNLLNKAKAVARFLEHDDALLASDALLALCEQLSVDRIDVANIEGAIIASSDTTRINLQLGVEEAFTWTMEAANSAEAALTRTDATTPNLLYACVGRSDIEGFILLARDDPFVADAIAKSGAEAQIADLTYGGDLLFIAQTGGEDGFFNESGNLCLRRTANGITLIAARPLTEVYAVRNGALIAFGTALTCIAICGIAAYLLRLEPVVSTDEDDDESALNSGDDLTGLPTRAIGEDETPRESKRERRRRAMIASEDADKLSPNESEERQEQHEHAQENAPRQAGRPVRRIANTKREEENGEDSFEKIVE